MQTDADTVTEKSVIAEYLHFSESEKKKSWMKMWCVIPKDELCIYFYGSHQVQRDNNYSFKQRKILISC